MAPGESIRGQIHLELPKATPVHSIEVCLTGTVTALDGTRLGSMKTATILEECKTVATASMTNTRMNTTRRHTTPAPNGGGTPAASHQEEGSTTRGRGRRSSMSTTMTQERTRSPAIPIQNTIAAAAAVATMAAQSHNAPTPSLNRTHMMARTLSMPSPYYASGAAAQTSSTLSLNRSMSPTPTGMRSRRTSFSANVDTPITGFGASAAGVLGGGRHNMSMVNISTITQMPSDDHGSMMDDPSLPAAPSYDPPEYEHIVGVHGADNIENGRSSGESSSSSSDAVVPGSSSAVESEITVTNVGRAARGNDGSSGSSGSGSGSGSDDASVPSTATTTSEDAAPVSNAHSRRSSREGINTGNTTTSSTPPPAEPAVEPKAVLMQPGNYVIPFSIRIPANTVMSLPGSFSDPVGNISYHLQAVMKQILPSPDPYNPRAIVVEPTFTSSNQVIKLIPMNDPTYMPLYQLPFETEPVRANVGHWVWSTGFMEAHAWVPKQGYRPGRMVPLVIHIVNHSDAKQIVVETTLCRCLHYGPGLTKIRAMGIAGQGYCMDPTLMQASTPLPSVSGGVETGGEDVTMTTTTTTTAPVNESSGGQQNGGGRRRVGRRNTSSRSQQQQQQKQYQAPEASMPSPPASPFGSSFPSTSTSEQILGDDSPEGSMHSVSRSVASPNSLASVSSQWGSMHSDSHSSSASNNTHASSDSHGTQGNHMATHPISGAISSSHLESRSSMTSSAPLGTTTATTTTTQQPMPVPPPLPIVQHQREKLSKSRTVINCSLAVDREIQKTIPIPIPHTTGYSILNAPLLEVSFEIVVKIRAEKKTAVAAAYSRNGGSGGIRLLVPIVVVIPEEGDMDDEDELLGMVSPAMMARDLGLAFSGDEYDLGDQGECPPYEATTGSGTRRRGRR
ncbi:Arrestin domain-containing protein 3 [Mortierella claussenii]|nr:Arrestin domain-containing protein 3 [Mortierella claussenii]